MNTDFARLFGCHQPETNATANTASTAEDGIKNFN